jgi:EAL domain-containing protein (putative c-di-GMP-specific phosphodiesterase class I)
MTIAHNLSLNVVAEGVEHAEQLEILRKLRCDVIQGYYYSKPLSAEDFGQFLLQQKQKRTKLSAVPVSV